MTFHPDSNLPECMMPDGGNCCAGYQALLAEWRGSKVDATMAKQLERSIRRNSRLMIALEQIANKTKMDAVAAVAMRAIARDAVKGNDDAD
jgi:hypothetical protein